MTFPRQKPEPSISMSSLTSQGSLGSRTTDGSGDSGMIMKSVFNEKNGTQLVLPFPNDIE